jgi:hypothetical protein
MHSLVWFWTIGIHDPAWVQAVAAIVLVLLTFVTLIYLRCYVRDTHTLAKTSVKQAKHMGEALALQEKAMEQWIELSNWRSQLVELPSEKTPNPFLLVKVDIVNKTNFPVTLKRAEIDFTTTGDTGKRTYFTGDDTFLPPNVPHDVEVASELTERQVSQFPLGGIGIQIAGRFSHIGALKKTVTQEVFGLLVCRKSETVFFPQIHMNPQPEPREA